MVNRVSIHDLSVKPKHESIVILLLSLVSCVIVSAAVGKLGNFLNERIS